MSVTVTVNGQAGPSVVAGAGDVVVASVTAASAVSVTASPAAAPGGTGPAGPQGPPSTTITVGSVSTLAAGSSATVVGTSSNNGANLSLAFGIPAGATGATGAAGATPTITASATTLAAGSSATVTATPSDGGSRVALAFGIPRGADGAAGSGGGASLSDSTPSVLGTASAGTSSTASRSDHVHAGPVISDPNLTHVPSTFAPSSHTHAVADVSGLQTALDGKQAAGSYATLVGGQVPSSQLPSFVDDVIDVGGTLPASGDAGKIYVVSTGGSANKIYRWSGSTFVEISPSPGSTDSVTEGSTNLYFTTARAAAAAPVQSVNAKTGTATLTAADVGAAATSHTHTLADLSQSSATTGQVPTWNGTAWAAATPSVGGGSYTLPTASESVLGGIKVGSGLSISSGVLSATGGGGGSANIVEAATASGFPATGASQTLYVATDVSRVYRWSGSVYVEIGPQ